MDGSFRFRFPFGYRASCKKSNQIRSRRVLGHLAVLLDTESVIKQDCPTVNHKWMDRDN